MNAKQIEYALARHFNWRRNLIVPNVSWGMDFRHELDLAVISKSGYLREIEIKVSASDIKADLKKRCWHADPQNRIKELWFAIPQNLVEYAELIPWDAGIYLINDRQHVKIFRQAKKRPARPLNDSELKKLYHLLSMRIWAMKRKDIRKKE